MLEYFEGILFLTTNRINAFDKAVRSRVHMALNFPKLTSQSRFKLWETFIVKVAEHSRSGWCDDAFLGLLAERELNGRQIKNAVRTAHALAVSKQQSLGKENLLSALDMLVQFDIQLEPDYADSPADAPTPLDYGRSRKRPRFY
jgi:AAA+ superfamily predicted ATPase